MISLTLGDVSFDRIDLNSKLANAFTHFYFDLGKNTKKYIKNGPIRVKNCELNPSSNNIDQEKIRVCKTYDIDGILGGVLPEAVGKAISRRFKINLDGKATALQHFFYLKIFNYIYKNSLHNISDCDKKFIGKFPLKIGDLNLFLIFPKKQIDRSIRNHRLFTAIKKIKFYETEVSHDVNRIIVAKQLTIDAFSFKATGTISIENVELFFSLLNEG